MSNVNNFTTAQCSTLMMEVYKEATGNKAIDTMPVGDFVSVAQMVQKTGYDATINAISKVLARTLFDIRPYTAKFKGIEVDEQKYGAITRELFPIDDPAFIDSQAQLAGISDGQSVDAYILHKPKVVELAYYGETVFQKVLTIFKDQLDLAFTSAEQFGQFLTMVMTAASNEIEQAIENVARATIANFAASTYVSDQIRNESVGSGNRYIRLITEYNTYFNLSSGDAGYIDSVATAIKTPEFWKWGYAYIGKKIEMMENRTELFHTALTNKSISQATPRDKMNIWVLSDFKRYMDTLAKASLYHDSYLDLEGTETVAFWQSARTPDQIKTKPTYLCSDGTLSTYGENDDPIVLSNVAMIVADKDALGYTRVNQEMASTPYNPRGHYTNLWYSWCIRYWNQQIRNGMVVVLA